MVAGGVPAAAEWEVAAAWAAGADARVAAWVQESESPSVPRARCIEPRYPPGLPAAEGQRSVSTGSSVSTGADATPLSHPASAESRTTGQASIPCSALSNGARGINAKGQFTATGRHTHPGQGRDSPHQCHFRVCRAALLTRLPAYPPIDHSSGPTGCVSGRPLPMSI